MIEGGRNSQAVSGSPHILMASGLLASNNQNGARKQRWAPKLWLGADFFGFLRLLVRNGFAIGPRQLHWLLPILVVTFRNTCLGYLQTLVWGKRVKEAKIIHDPLFIIGHWRSGTTWLHELLTLDPRHNYPTTYQCFFPTHFLLTEWYLARWLRFLLPDVRPADNVRLGWDRPQEDEFALCHLGRPSPYLTTAFPNRPPQYPEYFDLENLSPQALMQWKQCFLRFLKQITVRDQRRIVLKSPTHTYRIKVLLDLFPQAQFVHIVRNPYVVFPSTVNLWRSLYLSQGLQTPTCEGLDDYVFDNFTHMFRKLEEVRPLLDSSRFYELRYEDLVQDPIGQMHNIYKNLDLGDFASVLPTLKQYLTDTADYATNHYELDPEMRDRITQRWGHVIRQYGYT